MKLEDRMMSRERMKIELRIYRNQNRVSVKVLAVLSIAFLLLLQGCGLKSKPNLDRIFAEARMRQGKAPLIIIPGVLGTELKNKITKDTVWPAVFRQKDDELNLPISKDILNNTDNLEPGEIIDKIRLSKFVPEVYIYGGLIDSLKNHGGYRPGDWDKPKAEDYQDTFYLFPYDWRRDNVENARKLITKIEELKSKLNRPDLRFNILAHSMGGLISRYAAMYGNADLPADGVEPKPDWSGAKHIGKIFMFGVPNEGSMEAFASLLRGYSITEGLRRPIRLFKKLSREDMLTSPAIYQLLPHGNTALFLNEDLKPLKVDIYDIETWRKYGWSAAFDTKYRQDFAAKHKKELTAHAKESNALKELDAYMDAVLKRARAFHKALDAQTENNSPVLMFVFGGDCEETLNSPVIYYDKKKDKWITLLRPKSLTTTDGKKIAESDVVKKMFIAGDGRVTRGSLMAENLAKQHRVSNVFNTALPLTYAIFGCDLHGYLQNNSILQDNVLTALTSEAIK